MSLIRPPESILDSGHLAIFDLQSFCTLFQQCLCQGITPSNFKGGLPAPEAGAHAEEGGIRDEIDPSPSRSRGSRDKAETQSNRVNSAPGWSREEPTRRLSGSNPLQLQGGPYLPQRPERAQKREASEIRLTYPLAGRSARKTKQRPQTARLTQLPKVVERRARPGGPPEKEAERGATPCH